MTPPAKAYAAGIHAQLIAALFPDAGLPIPALPLADTTSTDDIQAEEGHTNV